MHIALSEVVLFPKIWKSYNYKAIHFSVACDVRFPYAVPAEISLQPQSNLLSSKVQHWQLIDIPKPISSYCPSLNLYPI